MESPRSRRAVLASLGTLSLAGCQAGPIDDGGSADGESQSVGLPASCPTTRGRDVAWPEEIDASTIASFVTAYEDSYLSEIVVEWEPALPIYSYDVSSYVERGPTATGDGYVLAVDTGGAINTPGLSMDATVADPPGGADVVPVRDVDDEPLTTLLEDAAATGEATLQIEAIPDKQRYLDLLPSLSDDFEPLTDYEDESTMYVDVSDTTVELSVRPGGGTHDDIRASSWYYVDANQVRRSWRELTDPEDGDVLECREL